MPRRKPPTRRAPPPRTFGDAVRRIEAGPGGEDYVVRAVPGARAEKLYRCPGCDHEIRPGVAHLVVWQTADPDGADRRHWHTGCWNGRATRGITRRWS